MPHPRAPLLITLVIVAALAVAGAVVASGTAQSTTAPDYLDGDGSSVAVVFAGQSVYAVDGPIADAEPGDDVNLRRADGVSGGEVTSSRFVETLTVADPADDGYPSAIRSVFDRAVRIETDDLRPGNYFLHGGDVDDLPRRPAESNTVELVGSTLAVSFANTNLTDDGDGAATDLDVRSNRGTYSLNVSADGDLDEETLLRIIVTDRNVDTPEGYIDDDTFDESDEVTVADVRMALVELRTEVTVENGERVVIEDDTATVPIDGDAAEVSLGEAIATDANPFDAVVYAEPADDADERIALYAIGDREREVSVADVDPGNYTVRFALIDAPVRADGSLTVSESSPSVEFVDPDGTPSDETSTPTPEATPTPTPEATPTPTPEVTSTPAATDGDTPGFGVVVALIALVATALLATRCRR